ncbi:SAM hydrolase/SAM-dependent halogenase family protein [Urechidicola vernalis]|uniref:SAM-dependent chlorinase/fluorinase n=1 Tax=Urechidicola vernalis TaxID=3075600 RepID=A0ABU2Y6G1_9FLAO|nr:SAM-dependent chlorinase/fluorinase [Urechidicola sp. P050]MDT0553794.1 SAM-dependent chlorinase/fluorinase [Urechidicola sp. P050]
MSLITLTTDFGLKDHFVGAVKGAIYTELPDVTIVDISHDISPFNIAETAYVMKNSYRSFPEGSIHIIGVDSELNQDTNHIALKLDNHFFICPNNGVISMIASDFKPEKIVEINIHDRVESSFPVLDVFVKVACHIKRGGTLEIIGRVIEDFKRLIDIQPVISSDNTKITGSVIYIDNYGNVITNINRKLFNEIGKGRPFTMHAGRYKFTKIFEKYSDIVNFDLPEEQRNQDGQKLIIFNSSDFIEVSIYRSNMKTVGGASSLLGLDYRDQLTITFE